MIRTEVVHPRGLGIFHSVARAKGCRGGGDCGGAGAGAGGRW